MSSQPLIANKVLAFINHAIDYMDEVSIMRICTRMMLTELNFKEDGIKSAMIPIFRKSEQMPSRRRDGGDKSVQDIIALMKTTDPDDVPAFVAKDLHKLHPVTFDYVDVTKLFNDITAHKTSLAAKLTRRPLTRKRHNTHKYCSDKLP